MTQICLLDSVRLSDLLKGALEWNKTVHSLLVSASNGSILATAFRDEPPEIKHQRSLSTTITTAYTVASEDRLVFEAQATRALTVVVPIADRVLLAVNGPPRHELEQPGETPQINGDEYYPAEGSSSREMNDDQETGEQAQIRADLEGVSEELAVILRKELSGLNWPQDI